MSSEKRQAHEKLARWVAWAPHTHYFLHICRSDLIRRHVLSRLRTIDLPPSSGVCIVNHEEGFNHTLLASCVGQVYICLFGTEGKQKWDWALNGLPTFELITASPAPLGHFNAAIFNWLKNMTTSQALNASRVEEATDEKGGQYRIQKTLQIMNLGHFKFISHNLPVSGWTRF